jgi:Flp pilus assembly protein TadG
MPEMLEITTTDALLPRRRQTVAGALKRYSTPQAADGRARLALRRAIGKLVKDGDGGALVEFAMVLPMMMVVVTGIFFLGISLALYLQLTNATDIGARLLSVSRGQTTDPCNTAVVAVEAAAPNLSTSNLTFNYTLDGQSYSGTSCTAGAAYLVQGTSAVLEVQYPVHLGIYGLGWSTITLKSQTTELVQ